MSAPRTGAPRAVFLDLDGCLVDSRVAISRCLNLGLEAVGVEPRREEELYPLIGPPLYESVAGLLREAGADPELAGRCVAAYREAYTDVSLTDTLVVEGMPEALARLAAVTTLAVVTSKPATFAEPILEAVALRESFVAVHAPDLDERHEPKAVTLARALDDVAPGVTPDATAMVGDRHHDIDAGHACGTRTVGVTWGIGDVEELAHAHRVVDTPTQLVDALLT